MLNYSILDHYIIIDQGGFMYYKILLTLLLLLVITFSFKEKAVAQNIENQKEQSVLFVESYSDALILSKEQDKKIFLLFKSEKCHWCDKQKQILMLPELSGNLNNYVICYIDILKEKDIAKKYSVKAVPAFFVIDGGEKIYKNNVGYLDNNEFKNWIKK